MSNAAARGGASPLAALGRFSSRRRRGGASPPRRAGDASGRKRRCTGAEAGARAGGRGTRGRAGGRADASGREGRARRGRAARRITSAPAGAGSGRRRSPPARALGKSAPSRRAGALLPSPARGRFSTRPRRGWCWYVYSQQPVWAWSTVPAARQPRRPPARLSAPASGPAQVGLAVHATVAPPPSPRSQAGPAARVLSVDEAGAGAASAALGWHSPALAASALGLRRSAGTGRSVGFFEAKNQDISKVARAGSPARRRRRGAGAAGAPGSWGEAPLLAALGRFSPLRGSPRALARGLHCTPSSLRGDDAHVLVLVCVFATAGLGVNHGACGAAAPPTPGPALRVRPGPGGPGRPRNGRPAAVPAQPGRACGQGLERG